MSDYIDRDKAMDRMKPCPFCGGEAELREGALGRKTYVYCKECLSTGKMFSISTSYCANDKAIEAWNRRPDK